MQDYLLLVFIVSPLIVAGVIAFIASQSLVSVMLVLLGAIAGAILTVLSGIFWLQMLHAEWIESQAAGFIFLPVVLPFFAYTGAIAGACLVAILAIYSRHHSSSCLFQAIAIGLTIVLAGLIPSAIVKLPLFFGITTDVSGIASNFLLVPVCAMVVGVVSSSLASKLANLFVGTT
ncbi:hypothetical protein [Nostoc sp. CMAA1605]|uniref:hypothetical protein n=1 Tax=Nostoc sp. CMAA1605 TaxID=2055159 RepID=UPI001F3E440C|nr:hypothetical protein [Nostoc sp. CMAA1605]MCF4967040.1 hypothetical protein [Nostoc sp. CMAA1605]